MKEQINGGHSPPYLLKSMKIAIASDHGGYELKKYLKNYLVRRGESCIDLGTKDEDSVDYPDFGAELALLVSKGKLERGILLCKSGIGMSIVANKFPKVRAALVTNKLMAKLEKEHNNANILVIGGGLTNPKLAKELVKIWLDSEFQGGRHLRRLKKIRALEKRFIRTEG